MCLRELIPCNVPCCTGIAASPLVSRHGMILVQATRTAANVMPAMVYERLPVADAAAAQLGCMLLDDRALLTQEVLEGRHCDLWKNAYTSMAMHVFMLPVAGRRVTGNVSAREP